MALPTSDICTFVAIDFETTGLRADRDRIVEIGAIRFNRTGADLGQFQTLVNPGCEVPDAARAIHGLSTSDLHESPTASEALPRFLDWIGSTEMSRCLLMAHNASFDASFLAWELARVGLELPRFRFIDTLPLSRRWIPALPNHRLATIAERLGFDLGDTHRALADCRRVRSLWLHLESLLSEQGGVLAASRPPLFGLPDPSAPFEPHFPLGYDWVMAAMRSNTTIRIVYDGGTKGSTPRAISPRAWCRRGGSVYISAFCQGDQVLKEFRLERMALAEPLDPATSLPLVDLV